MNGADPWLGTCGLGVLMASMRRGRYSVVVLEKRVLEGQRTVACLSGMILQSDLWSKLMQSILLQFLGAISDASLMALAMR